MNLADLFTLIVVISSDDDLIRSDYDDDDDDDLVRSDEAEESASDDGMSFFEEEETKSRFTNYSMTSSVLRRNEGWKKQKANDCYDIRVKPSYSFAVIR